MQDTTKPIEEIRQEKIKKIEKLKEMGINPFPQDLKFDITSVSDIRQAEEDFSAATTGRIQSIRGHGKIRFIDIYDASGTLQLVFKAELILEKTELLNLIDPGDFIEAKGKTFTTKSGEFSLLIEDFNLLTKSIRPLPDITEGLKDKETRLRKRYLDLLLNDETRELFRIRHGLTRGIRGFLTKKGLTEVETPVLQPLYGGANAKPFTTHINAIDTTAYLRIASELYLKRLMVTNPIGVFDIAKDFRNEGIDQTHFPEFTMLEAYLGFADYHKMMDLMEEMVLYLADTVLSTKKLTVGNDTINLATKWPRISIAELLKQHFSLDIGESNRDKLEETAKENNLVTEEKMTSGEIAFIIFDKLIADKLVEPTWVIDYPVEISPLAKEHRHKKGFVERFELYIGGREVMDGWSEINNPLTQRERFLAEQKRNFDESETAQPLDEDYLEAMEYGIPPTAGVGVGIDRLTMFFSNNWSIQETILFPFKKPVPHEK